MASFWQTVTSSQNKSYFAALLPRMLKVPERFRKGNEEFYRARVVTIGPYHDFDAQFVVPHPRADHVSLPQLVRHFFNAHLFDKNNIPPTPTDGDEFQFDQHSIIRNLVACVRSFYSPRPKSSRSPSASDGDTSNQFDQHSIMRNLVACVRSFYSPRPKSSRSPSASDGDTSNNVNDARLFRHPLENCFYNCCCYTPPTHSHAN